MSTEDEGRTSTQGGSEMEEGRWLVKSYRLVGLVRFSLWA